MKAAVVWLGSCGVLVGIGLAVFGGAVDPSYVRNRDVPGLAGWAVLGIVPLAGSILGLWALQRGARHAFLAGLVTATVLFFLPVVGWMLDRFDAVKAAHPLIERTQAAVAERDIRLASYGVDYYPSLNFYSRREVCRLHQPEDIAAFLRCPLPVYVFAPANLWQDINARVNAPHRVAGRHRDMYRGTDLLVVTNR